MKVIGPDWLQIDLELQDISGTLWARQPTLDEINRNPSPHRYLLVEPSAVAPWDYEFADKYNDKFYQILTFNKYLLSKYKHATLLYFGTTWISSEVAEESHEFPKKDGVSFLCGSLSFLYGHVLRRKIYDSQNILEASTGITLDFYRSSRGELIPSVSPRGNPLIYQDKSALHLPYRFSIVIENSTETNYFSEKIVDCFMCHTIPIYWGCDNIETFFNTNGMIQLQGDISGVLQQLSTILPACTEELYIKMLPALKDNHKRSYKYANYLGRIVESIRAY